MLSLILVASVTFPHISSRQILLIMIGFAGLALIAVAVAVGRRRGGGQEDRVSRENGVSKENWRMPALTMLAPAPMSVARRAGMTGMWVYLAVAIGAVVFRIIEVATGH
jgi:hypothetical protein